MLEPKSFNMCINTAASIIMMSGCLEVNMKVSDIDIETVESNNYTKVSEDNRDTNGVLATTQERAKFFHKYGQKFTNLFT